MNCILPSPGMLPNPELLKMCIRDSISSEMIAEYTQYAENFVLSAIAPDTMVAAVAQNTRLNTKLDQS